MCLHRVFTCVAGVLLFVSIDYADPVSFVSGYVGYLLSPGPSSISDSWPRSGSYSSTTTEPGPGGIQTYSVSENTFGNLTTASLQLANSLSGVDASYNGYVTANSFSGANLLVEQPVYISDSVTVSYSSTYTGYGFAFEDEYFQFDDSHGHPIGTGCALNPLGPSPQTCSTGMVLVGAGSEISINNDLVAGADVFVSGDSASFQGTATAGPLQVYNLNGTLIETLDLSNIAPVPEPKAGFAVGVGLAGLLLAAAWRARR